MTTLTVSDKFKADAEARAAAAGYASVTEYLEALVEADTDYGAPEDLRVRSREHLAELIREGLASPASEMTAADFAEMRAELNAKYGKAKAG